MGRFAWPGATAVAVLLALPGITSSVAVGVPSGTDRVLTPEATARGVTAVGGSVSWRWKDVQGQPRRVLMSGGAAGDLPVAPNDVTFGPGTDGHPTLVYSRSTGDRATLERFDTVTGTEAPAAAPQAVGRGCDIIGAVSGDLLAYALTGPPKRCRALLRVTSSGGRALLTRRGFNVSKLALDRRNLAVLSGEFSVRLRLINLVTGRGVLVAREDASAYGGAGTITDPGFAGGRLYFAMTSINASGTFGSTLGPFKVTPGRTPSCATSRRAFGDNVLLESFAVDPPNAYYGDGEHLYQTQLASLRFGRSKKGAC